MISSEMLLQFSFFFKMFHSLFEISTLGLYRVSYNCYTLWLLKKGNAKKMWPTFKKRENYQSQISLSTFKMPRIQIPKIDFSISIYLVLFRCFTQKIKSPPHTNKPISLSEWVKKTSSMTFTDSCNTLS